MLRSTDRGRAGKRGNTSPGWDDIDTDDFDEEYSANPTFQLDAPWARS